MKVTPTGRRVYLVQYRVDGRAGRTRRYTIGQHGPLTPQQARTEAKRLLGLVGAGKDPSSEHNAEKTALTLEEVGAKFTAHIYLPYGCQIPRSAIDLKYNSIIIGAFI